MKIAFTISLLINLVCVVIFAIFFRNHGNSLSQRFNYLMQPEKVPKRPNDLDYYHTKTSIFKILPRDSQEIIFLGSSLIDHCPWNEMFQNPHIKNRGIGGDRISGVMERLDSSFGGNPTKIFLMIGINDIGAGRNQQDILNDYDSLLLVLKTKYPLTKIYVHSILPTDDRKELSNEKIQSINAALRTLVKNHQMTYIDLYPLLLDGNNRLNTAYTYDGLHLNGAGYLIWKQAIEKMVEE